MKAILAAIIAASLSVGCSVLEGEQVSSDTGGGGTTSPAPSGNNSNGPTVYMDCDSGVESPTRSAFSEHAVWSRNVTNCDGDGWVSADTTDENGNFYSMKNESGSLSGTTNTKIVKLNNNGSEQWSQELSSDFEILGFGDSNRLIVDTQGNIYGIASENHHYGPSSDNQTIKRTLFKYSSTGVKQWRVEDTYTILAGSQSHSYYPLEAFVDSSGNFYTSRRREFKVYDNDTSSHNWFQGTTINKYSSSTGEKLWSKEFVSDNANYHHPGNVVFENSDGFYMRTQEDVYDNDSMLIDTEHKIVKYNNDGVEQWSKSVPSESIHSLTVIEDNVYFTDGSNSDGYNLLKYSHAGVELWNFSVPYSHVEIRLAQDGSVYLSGGYRTITKYSSAGSLLWTEEFDSDPEFVFGHSSVNLDGNGNVYLFRDVEESHDNGTKTFRSHLAKYSSSNGVEQWKLDGMDVTVDASEYDYMHSWSHPIIDASGNVFVHSHIHGYKSASTPGDENHFGQTVLAKYSSDGTKLWEESVGGGLIPSQNGEVYLYDEGPPNFDSMGYPMPGPSFYLKLR